MLTGNAGTGGFRQKEGHPCQSGAGYEQASDSSEERLVTGIRSEPAKSEAAGTDRRPSLACSEGICRRIRARVTKEGKTHSQTINSEPENNQDRIKPVELKKVFIGRMKAVSTDLQTVLELRCLSHRVFMKRNGLRLSLTGFAGNGRGTV